MYRAAICEDDPAAMEYLRELITSNYEDEFQIKTYGEATDLLDEWEKAGERLSDVIFMDIRFQDENGIEVAKKLKQRFAHAYIIFVTGFVEYAEEIFEADPVYFLLKPVSEEKLKLAVNKALEYLQKEERECITIPAKGGTLRLRVSDVLFMESKLREAEIHDFKNVWKVNLKLGELEKMMPDDFVRIHQSFLVNLNCIKQFSKNLITLQDGTELPVSRARYKNAKEKFMNYLHTCAKAEF